MKCSTHFDSGITGKKEGYKIGKDDTLAGIGVGRRKKHRYAAIVREDMVPYGVVRFIAHHEDVFVGGVNGNDFSAILQIREDNETNEKGRIGIGLGNWFRNQRRRNRREKEEGKDENEHKRGNEKTSKRDLLNGVALPFLALQFIECLEESLRIRETERKDATLGIVEKGVRAVDLEPVNDVQRRGRDCPVENLVNLKEEGDVAVALSIVGRKKDQQRR